MTQTTENFYKKKKIGKKKTTNNEYVRGKENL
jgi:hypothetical protein